MKKLLLAIILHTSIIAAAQQDTIILYLHQNLNPCPKENASYIVYGLRNADGKIDVNVHLMANDRIIMKGSYTDTTLNIRNGFFQYFNPTGGKESAGYYKNNLEDGGWAHYSNYSNSNDEHVIDSTFYENGVDISIIHFNYHENGRLSSRVLSNSRDKVKTMDTWNEDGIILSKAVWIDNTGDKFEYYADGTIRSVESYKNGISKNIKYYRSDGSAISKKEMEKERNMSEAGARKKLEELTPSFPGGQDGFRGYLDKHFRIPSHLQEYIKNLQVITIVFLLNEKGFPTNVTILETNNTDLLNAVIDFFRNIPHWDMKGYKQYGPLKYQIAIR